MGITNYAQTVPPTKLVGGPVQARTRDSAARDFLLEHVGRVIRRTGTLGVAALTK